MFCSFIMAFQSLHPHVTDVYVFALTILTPGWKLITMDRSNPSSKTKIDGNVSPTFILNFDMFLYTWNEDNNILLKKQFWQSTNIMHLYPWSIVIYIPWCWRSSDNPIPVLKIHWYNYPCAEVSVTHQSISYKFSATPITVLKIQWYTYHCV